jgi:hypothetical protein
MKESVLQLKQWGHKASNIMIKLQQETMITSALFSKHFGEREE